MAPKPRTRSQVVSDTRKASIQILLSLADQAQIAGERTLAEQLIDSVYRELSPKTSSEQVGGVGKIAHADLQALSTETNGGVIANALTEIAARQNGDALLFGRPSPNHLTDLKSAFGRAPLARRLPDRCER